jgi:hypothetical protein
MWKSRCIEKRVAGFALTLAVLWVGAIIPQGWAQDLTAPAQVVDDYLASLVSGDTERLNRLIDGPMKAKNSHLVDNADSYSGFLKKHYAGVQTSVEEIIPDGVQTRARVRFDFPTQDSSVIEFILTQVDGQWKITDENY